MDFLLSVHPAIFIGLAIVATMLFLPGSITLTLAGFLFGLVPGLLYGAIAISIGAQFAFEFSRWIARPWVQRRTAGSAKIRALEAGLREEAFTIITLARLSLVVPFNLFNYVCGASSAKASTYFVATAIGMTPAIALFVYLGTLAHDIGQVISGTSTPTELSWWLLGAGVVLLAVLISIVRRIARRALAKHIHSKEEEPSVA